MELLLATRNKNKVNEIRLFFNSLDLTMLSLDDFPEAPAVVEDGETFEENAVKKAVELAGYTGVLTLADDSGLVVDALVGEPGVMSSRYAGEDATDHQNNQKLLDEMKNVPGDRRSATFVCCIAVADKNGLIRAVEGKCNGLILTELRGREGFGYDPLFVKHDYNKSFAELPMELKNRISHRASALDKAQLVIESHLLGLGRRDT